MGFRAKLSAKVTWVSTFLLLFFSPKMAKTQMAGCSLQGLGLEQCLNQGKNSISIDQSCCIVLNQVVQAGFHCLCLLLASHNPPLSTPLVFPLSSNCFISAPPLTQCQALVPVLQPPVPPLQPPVTPALQPPVPPALPVLLPPDTPQEPPGTPALPVLTPPHFPQEPPVTPALPVLLPPDIPQEPPQPPAPNAFLLPPPPPPPPPPQELPLKSTSEKNSTTPAMQPSLNNNSAPDLSTFKTGYFLISEGHKKTISFQSRLSIAATLCACMI